MADQYQNDPDRARRMFEAQLGSLRREYSRNLPGRLRRVRELWAALRLLSPLPAELVEPLREDVHRLAGSGAAYGYQRLSGLMRRAELLLDRMVHRPSEGTASVPELDEIFSQFVPPPQDGHQRDSIQWGVGGRLRPEVPRVLVIASMLGLLRRQCKVLQTLGFEVRCLSPEEVSRIADPGSDPSEMAQLAQRVDIVLLEFDVQAPPLPAFLSSLTPRPPVLGFCPGPDLRIRIQAWRRGYRRILEDTADIDVLAAALEECFVRRSGPAGQVLALHRTLPGELAEALGAENLALIRMDSPEQLSNVRPDRVPDLVLLELEQDHGNGIELAAALRQSPGWSTVPLLLMGEAAALVEESSMISRFRLEPVSEPIPPVLLKTLIQTRIQQSRDMEVRLERDPVSGLLRPEAIRHQLAEQVARADRASSGFCLVQIELRTSDKGLVLAVNDRALACFGHLLRARLRRGDLCGRWTDCGFLIVLVEAAPIMAQTVVEGLQQAFQTFCGQTGNSVSCVAAVAEYRAGTGSAALLAAVERSVEKALTEGLAISIAPSPTGGWE